MGTKTLPCYKLSIPFLELQPTVVDDHHKEPSA